MARGWVLRILTCLAVLTVLVTGCSQTPKQEPKAAAPTRSATPSPTLPPLGPTDFPVPAEARQKTEAGVLAFTRYYIELVNHLLISRDSTPLRDLSRNCEDCNSMVRGLDKAKAAGLTYEGGKMTITWLSNAVLRGDTAEAAFLLEQQAATVRDANGSVVPDKSGSAYPLNGGIALAWDEERSTWVVTTFTADRN